MSPKPPAKRRLRSGIMNEQVKAETVVAGMMARDLFSQWLGLTIVDVRPRTCTVRATVRPEMVNGFGVAHGGIVFAIADSAFAFACNSHNQNAVAQHCSVTFIRPGQRGEVLDVNADAPACSECGAITVWILESHVTRPTGSC